MNVTKEIRQLLLMNASSNIIFNFIGIFVNLFIWEKERSIFDVTWFNLVLFLCWIGAFALGAKLLTKFSTRILIRAIAICGAITFLLLIFFHLDNKLLWIAIIAAPISLMWGFYAVSQNISLCVFGKGKDFEGYFSLSSIIGQAVSIINPIVFALVINWLGYSGSFLLMFVFVTLLLVVSFFIPDITLKHETESLFAGMSFRRVYAPSSLRWIAASCLTAGVFLQFQGLFALLFTFSVSENKLIIALLNVCYASSTIGAMKVYKRFKGRDGLYLLVGMLAISCGFLITLYPKAPILILSNLLTTIGMYYFGTIWNTRHFRVISQFKPLEQARILIWREWSLCVSRVFMLILILRVKEFHGTAFILLMAFALVCSLAIPYLSGRGVAAAERQAAGLPAEQKTVSG